jgi:hypothetical protein
LERSAIASGHGDGDLVAGSDQRNRTALLLESIALRHQITVLKRSQPVAHAFGVLIGCFGSSCRAGGRNGVKAW